MHQSKNYQQVIESCNDNPDQYAIIIQDFEPKLRSYISKLGSYSSSEVEDILQETFIKAWKNLNSFNPKYSFSTWIYRIARNEAHSFFRKWSRTWKDISFDSNEYTFGYVDDFIESLEGKFNSSKIQKTLDNLSEKYREVLVLYYFQELSYLEISEILKKPTNTIGTMLSRAKKQFKQEWHKVTIQYE